MSGALDALLPQFRHREVHAATIAASPEEVWAALHAVTGRELQLTRLLMCIRGSGAPGDGVPFLETMAQRFSSLVHDAPWTLVTGAAGQPWRLHGGETVACTPGVPLARFDRPGYTLLATSFELSRTATGTRLKTETRIQPADATAARAFRRYWWMIRAGSGVIRRDLLRAVRNRAEQHNSTPTAD